MRQLILGPGKVQQREQLSVVRYAHPREFPPEVLAFMSIAERGNYESSAAWYGNLIDAVFSADAGVHFYTLLKNQSVMAVLPLRAKRTHLGGRVESLSNYYTALYEPILEPNVEVEDLAFLLLTLVQQLGRVVSLKLSPMDPESANYRKLLAALRRAGLLPFEYFCFGNWFSRCPAVWSEYLKTRDGAVRSTIKRMSKRFNSAGGTLEIIQGTADLERGLAAYQQVYAASWKTAEPFVNFMPGLMKACAEHGKLLLGLAWLDGRPIAAQFWIVSNGKASIYKLAYDEAFKSYASGTLLTAQLMQHVIERGDINELDYLIGDDAYKKQWMSGRRERWGILAYNPRRLPGLAGSVFESSARLVKALTRRTD